MLRLLINGTSLRELVALTGSTDVIDCFELATLTLAEFPM
jgi:hypothetical protein